MPLDETDVLAHIQCSHAALDIANTEMTKMAAVKEASAKLIPDAVEALIKHKRINPADREKAAQALADPVQALKVLISTADPFRTTEPVAMGAPEGTTKTAGTKKDGYTGLRPAGKTAADEAFERHFRTP